MKTVKLQDLHKERGIYIKVTEEESKLIQQQLFRDGLHWYSNTNSTRDVQHTNQEVIGIFCDGSLTYFDHFTSSLTQENIRDLDYKEVVVDFDVEPTLELSYMETCLPDYHAGHHLPVVQVPVTCTTTFQELKDMLSNTYMCIDHLEDVDSDAYLQAVTDYFDLHKESIGSYDAIVPMCVGIEPIPENLQDNVDNVYMYFVLDTEEE